MKHSIFLFLVISLFSIALGISVIGLITSIEAAKSNQILHNKVESVKVDVISANIKKQEYISNDYGVQPSGKTGYSLQLHEDETLIVNYKYQGKNYKTSSSDYIIRKKHGKPFAKIMKSEIGKNETSIVLYKTTDK